MDLFRYGETVKLRSWHGLYLTAAEDGKSVTQGRMSSSAPSGLSSSSRGNYLAASNEPFLLGWTGRKVLLIPQDRRPDSSVVWFPLRSDRKVALETPYGRSLRANFSLPPWSSSVTHDQPQLGFSQDWILWDVEVVDPADPTIPLLSPDDSTIETSVHPWFPAAADSRERTVAYSVVDNLNEKDVCVSEIQFKGKSLEELTAALRHPTNGKLYPLRLRLAPGDQKVEVVLVRASPTVRIREEFRKR
ncbi:unnamed protein product [Spirodela intermedia]|uniref:DUF569 domain-containing protein n=1 Tax=Spirodela intermedia TaxID=51605 RepID=A0A7I8JB00_SPIIN|nr:unnamed protein product [Spirodela intermedia]CAA6667279.1 unnamed protein product [Spirodela intermedia]